MKKIYINFLWRKKGRYLLLALCTFLISNDQINTSSIAGYTPGEFQVSPTGGATYTIPLIVSPGTAGMEPRISIAYNHQSANGYLGMGWHLDGLSSINRVGQIADIDGRSTAVALNTNDRFSLNGDRLILKENNRSYGSNSTFYLAEHNPFDQIQSFGDINDGPAYFIVKTKAGLTMEFGRTSDSRIEAAGTNIPLRWLLNKVTDAKGNYFTINYLEDNQKGESYPISIEYTGNQVMGLEPYNTILFEYEDRPDKTAGYVSQTIQQVTKRLAKIKSLYKEEIVRGYRLNYEEIGQVRQSVLAKIQEFTGTGEGLNPTVFEYSNDSQLYFKSYKDPIVNRDKFPGAIDLQSLTIGDFNNDGISDLIFKEDGKNGVSIILGDKSFNTLSNGVRSTLPNAILISGQVRQNYSNQYLSGKGEIILDYTPEFFTTGDFNGDGKTDMLTKYRDEFKCFISYSEENRIEFQLHFDLKDHFFDDAKVITGDFDGNGIDDILVYKNNGESRGYYFSATGRQIRSIRIDNILPNLGSFYEKYELSTSDINADGVLDLFFKSTDNDKPEFLILKKKPGSSLFEELKINLNSTQNNNDFFLIDFNNDGLPDLIKLEKDGSNPDKYHSIKEFYLNHGNFFFGQGKPINIDISQFMLPGVDFFYGGPLFVDANLDNNVDILLLGYRNASSAIWLGDGKGDFRLLSKDINFNPSTEPSIIRWTWRPGRFFSTPSINLLEISNNYDHFFNEIYTEPKYQLTKIQNGHGQTIKITYQPTGKDDIYQQTQGFQVSYPQMKYQGPLYVVSYVTRTNGTQRLQSLSYHYEDAVIQHKGRGFLGFRKMITRDYNANARIVNEYNLDHRLGQNISATYIYVNDKLINETRSNYEVIDLPQKVFGAVLSSSSSKQYDPNDGALLNETKSSFYYDAFANLTGSNIRHTDGRVDSLANIYENDPVKWQLGRLLKSIRIVTEPGKASITKSASFEYDESGLLKKEVSEPNDEKTRLTTEYERDPFGNIITTITSGWNGREIEQRIKKATYNDLGRFLIATSDDFGFKTEYQNDPATGNILSIKDPNGLIKKKQYDSFGRLVKEIFPDGNWNAYDYQLVNESLDGRFTTDSVTLRDSKGRHETTYFDELDRTIRIKLLNPFGHFALKDYVYNDEGELVKESLPYFEDQQALWMQRDYDQVNRIVKEIYPDGTRKSFAYEGLETKSVNELGQKAAFLSDIHGNTILSTDNINNTVEKEFDFMGNIIKVAAENRNLVNFKYNLRGLLIEKTDLSAGTEYYTYNGFGELIERKTSNGTTQYAYDKLGRLINRIDGRETTVYSYDSEFIGKLSSISIGNRYLCSFKYDPLGREIKRRQQFEGETFVSQTNYNNLSEIESITYPSGDTIKYTYSLGIITAVHSGAKTLWQLQDMDAFNRGISFNYGNNSVTTRQFDPIRGFLTHTATATSVGLIQNWDFKFDPIGNLLAQRDNIGGKEEHFTYNDLNQLILSRVIGGDSLAMEYDNRGNLLYKSDVGRYFWNEQGKLDSILLNPEFDCTNTGLDLDIFYTSFAKVKSISNDSVTISLVYGPDYERIAHRVYLRGRLVQTRYYTGLEELDVASNGNKTIRTYLSNGAELFGVIEKKYRTPTKLSYFHKNHLGSIVAISDENGKIIEKLNYDPWGNRRAEDWSYRFGKYNSAITNKGFTEHEHYYLLSVINMGGRVYDPRLGIFLSADPLYQDFLFSHLLNRYSYVQNNPLSLIDPSGYGVFSWVGDVEGAISDGVKWVGGKISDGAQYVGGIIKDNWKLIATYAAVAIVSAVVPGGPIIAGIAGGFAGGLTGSLLNGESLSSALGNAIKGAVIGGFSGVFTQAVGDITAHFDLLGDYVLQPIGEGIVQGGVSELKGSDFLSGFAYGAVSASVSDFVALTESSVDNKYIRFTAALSIKSLGRGTANYLSGESFGKGLAIGGLGYIFNKSKAPIRNLFKEIFSNSKTDKIDFEIKNEPRVFYANTISYPEQYEFVRARGSNMIRRIVEVRLTSGQ